MKITLKQAYDLLERCGPVSLDLTPGLYPDLSGLDEEEFLRFTWMEDDQEFIVRFLCEDNQTVTIDGEVMILVNSEGQEEVLYLWWPADLEEKIK